MIIASRVSNKRFTDQTYRKAPTRKEPDGKLSPNARRKMKNAIRWLIACSPDKKGFNKQTKKWEPYRINLITLTFKHNMQDDAKARMLLVMWLEMARYRWSLERYVWKAEPQERGAIHFHIATGMYIPHKEIQYTWNRLLAKHELAQPYANSTDVHACFNVRNLEAYLTEYLMNDDKHAGRRMIRGRLWSCDHKLSQAGKKYLYCDNEDAYALQKSLDEFDLRHRMNSIKPFMSFTDIYCLPKEFWKDHQPCDLVSLYLEELDLLKPSLAPKQLFPMRELIT